MRRPARPGARSWSAHARGGDGWLPLGKVPFRDNSSVSVLDGATLIKVVDRAVASAFVTVKPARRTLGSTTLKVENRLPFTVSNLVVKAGTSRDRLRCPSRASASARLDRHLCQSRRRPRRSSSTSSSTDFDPIKSDCAPTDVDR